MAGIRRFEPLAFVGKGWSGSVHKVFDRDTGAIVAAKSLDVRDPERLYRLKQEFRSLARIRHPNLVELYELVVNPEECFFTMELIDGCDFLTYVRGELPDDPSALLARFRNAARQLATGLVALHRSGTLHRDLKPPNVLVDRRDRLVILDFGLSSGLSIGGRASGELVGTLDYIAPEQFEGRDVGPAADWYAAGVMLYEALAGQLPFLSGTGFGKAPPPLRPHSPWVPPAIEETVLALLNADPAARPAGEVVLTSLDDDDLGRIHAAAERPVEPRFVDRAEERAALDRALEAVRSGPPLVVHVHGPSGIGKTELVRRFVDDAERDGDTVVLRGRCHAQETVPYNAIDGIVDSLTALLRDRRDAEAEALLPKDAAELLRLFPVLARVPAFERCEVRPSPADPRESRRRGFAALRELLGKLAASRRLVLWVDDAQWCDEDSRELAREILRSPDPPSLLFVFTHRPEDRERVPFARAEEGDDVVRAEISVGPLAIEATRELARHLSGGHRALDPDVIASQAGGSPFFVAALAQQPAEVERGEAPIAPADLAMILRRRVERLPLPEQRLLQAVSVAGQPVEREVALDASGVGQRSWTLLINLEKENLLRTVRMRDEEGVEIYHDRIREALLAGLSANELRDRHRHLAESLATRPKPDPRALFRHFLGAEEIGSAAKWGVEAADRADQALAFGEAAELYAQVLPLVAKERRRQIEIRRATALVNAGSGAAAAPIFLAAASTGPTEEQLDLRRRAGEQFLLTGHMDEGVEVIRALLGDFGIRYPRTSAAIVSGTAVRLAGLALAGTSPRRRPRPTSDPTRGDVCHAAFKGLAQVDPARALLFGLRSLSYSVRSGDRFRTARDLSATGAALIPVGGAIGRWAARMIERGRKLALELEHPHLEGFSSIAMAQKCMVEARWREMLEHCDSGGEVLNRNCRGVSWELGIARMAGARALEELGDFPEMARRMDRSLREAESSNDVYGVVVALGYLGLCRLAADDPAAARKQAQRVLQLWTVRGFHMQHFYVFRLESCCALYEGQPKEAWFRIERTWSDLRSSNLLRHTVLFADAHLLRARGALAVARSNALERDRMLREAESSAARLERTGRIDTSGHASLIRAASLAQRGRRAEALKLLDRAAEIYRSAEMALCESCADFRAGELAGDDARVTRAKSVLDSLGIVDPLRFLGVYAPGF